MITIFIDTSVLFSACLSKIGASAFILGFCCKNKIKGFISRYVLSEIKRNAEQKLDQLSKQRLNFYILQSDLNIVDNPTLEEVKICQKVMNQKDAPILAAAVKNKANYLITFNTKDFLLPKVKDFVKSLTILTPRNFIMLIK